MPASVIAELFDHACRDRPLDAVAIRDLTTSRSLSFGELRDQSLALRSAFAKLGLARGACIVSLIGNRPLFFPLVVAAMEVGAALLPLGDVTDAEATALIDAAGAQAVITDRTAWTADGDLSGVSVGDGVRIARFDAALEPPYYGEAVVLKLTSGSTDLPKAAIASERHVINDGRHIVEAMGIGRHDVNFACVPISHSYGIGNLVMPLLMQGTQVALRQSFNAASLMPDLMASGATIFPGVPFMFDHIRSLGPAARLPRALRLLITAGARIDPQTVDWFRACLNRKLHSFYGSSETGGIAYDDSEIVQEPGDVGRPMPETCVTIERTGAAAGRIFVRGNAVAFGYARTVGAASTAAFRDGGFLSRDLGALDEEGRLVLTGRASELVNVAGHKVDPVEVERTLLALPGIADARVLGASCDRRGQQVVAFVVRTNAALTALAIRQLCAGTLSTYKIPRRFIFLERLPIDARGKTDRRALEALAVADASLQSTEP